MNVPKRVSVPWNSLRPQIARVLRSQAQSAQTSGLLQEIDHVAIAVRDLEAAIEWYRQAFGAVVVHREVVERDQVEEALIAVSDSYIQLLTPTSDSSPVAQVLGKARRGPSPRRIPREGLCRGARIGEGVRGRDDRQGPEAGFAWAPRSLSSTRRVPSAPSSSWSRSSGSGSVRDPTGSDSLRTWTIR